MPIALPSLVGGGLGKQPGEGKGQEMGAQGDSEMPSTSICVLGTEKLLGLQFPSSPSCFPGPWLFPARSTLLAGACELCGGGCVFQQGKVVFHRIRSCKALGVEQSMFRICGPLFLGASFSGRRGCIPQRSLHPEEGRWSSWRRISLWSLSRSMRSLAAFRLQLSRKGLGLGTVSLILVDLLASVPIGLCHIVLSCILISSLVKECSFSDRCRCSVCRSICYLPSLSPSPFPPFSGRGSVGLLPHQSRGWAGLGWPVNCGRFFFFFFPLSLSLSLSLFSGPVGLWACCPPVTDTDGSRDTSVTKGQLLHLACPACLF